MSCPKEVSVNDFAIVANVLEADDTASLLAAVESANLESMVANHRL